MTKVICFDIRCLQIGHESRGIGMHVRSILENIDPDEDYEYMFYAYEKNDPIKALAIKIPVPYTLVQTKNLKKSIDRPRDFIHLAKVIFHRFTALRGITIDTFVQFDFMLGLPKLSNIKRTVLVAYDLIPLIFKEDYIPTPSAVLRSDQSILRKLKKALRALYYQGRYHLHYNNFKRANVLLSISENTTQSLVDILKIPRTKIITIPLAPVFNTSDDERPKELQIKKPFIFYIGATDARKRIRDLIEAFNVIRRTDDIDLVLAGKEFSKPNKIPNESILESLALTPYRKNIHTLGYVNDSEKLWLYKNAQAFVFPTAYEGFGLPVLEAFQNGCPVISYSNSSIPEIAGDAAILVRTGDILQLATEVRNLINNPELRKTIIKLGYAQSKMYTWKNYMNNFYSLLKG